MSLISNFSYFLYVLAAAVADPNPLVGVAADVLVIGGAVSTKYLATLATMIFPTH